jgi:hypothetical protein
MHIDDRAEIFGTSVFEPSGFLVHIPILEGMDYPSHLAPDEELGRSGGVTTENVGPVSTTSSPHTRKSPGRMKPHLYRCPMGPRTRDCGWVRNRMKQIRIGCRTNDHV